ncbi:LysR family transcriptional regulator [Kibdelosporangium lantanae]
MPEPEIRELRYFRAVADELNITRAAVRLGIAQPPLSRAIRQLERRLGVDLFDRTGPRLALTPAGEVFREEAAAVLDALDTAVRRTRHHGLVVTAKPGVATHLLRQATARFAADPDAPPLRVVVSGFGEQADMVRDGRADVAIAACVDDHGLDTSLLATEPRVAALPVGHRLTDRVLTIADLRGEPVWTWSNGPVVRDTAQLLEMAALGQVVALVPTSLAAVNVRPDVTYCPVSDAAPYRTLAVWATGRRSPWIARFVATARACTVRQ